MIASTPDPLAFKIATAGRLVCQKGSIVARRTSQCHRDKDTAAITLPTLVPCAFCNFALFPQLAALLVSSDIPHGTQTVLYNTDSFPPTPPCSWGWGLSNPYSTFTLTVAYAADTGIYSAFIFGGHSPYFAAISPADITVVDGLLTADLTFEGGGYTSEIQLNPPP